MESLKFNAFYHDSLIILKIVHQRLNNVKNNFDKGINIVSFKDFFKNKRIASTMCILIKCIMEVIRV